MDGVREVQLLRPSSMNPSDNRPCDALENPRPKGGTETQFIKPDCLGKRGVCPIPAEQVHFFYCDVSKKIESE